MTTYRVEFRDPRTESWTIIGRGHQTKQRAHSRAGNFRLKNPGLVELAHRRFGHRRRDILRVVREGGER